MHPRNMFARTYQQAKKNLEDGFISLGLIKRPEDSEANINDRHPLIWIMAEYKEGKQAYAYQLSLKNNKISQEELDGLKYGLDCLHDIIQDSIRALSSEKLLSINAMTKGNEYPLYSHSVMSCLGEIGAVDLFDLLLEKIGHAFSVKDWVTIYKDLKKSYEGNALTESLGLGSSFLHRGDVCFVDMARLVFVRLIAENKLDLFFSKLLKSEMKYTDSIKITIEKSLAFHQNNLMEEWSREKYIEASVRINKWSQQCTKNSAEDVESEIDESVYGDRFDRFVIMHNYQDIFAQLTMDYMIPYLIKNGEYHYDQQHGVRTLFCQSVQALFEQNKGNDCVVYDSLSTNLLLFKRAANTVSMKTVELSEQQGKDMLAEIKSTKFSLNSKKTY